MGFISIIRLNDYRNWKVLWTTVLVEDYGMLVLVYNPPTHKADDVPLSLMQNCKNLGVVLCLFRSWSPGVLIANGKGVCSSTKTKKMLYFLCYFSVSGTLGNWIMSIHREGQIFLTQTTNSQANLCWKQPQMQYSTSFLVLNLIILKSTITHDRIGSKHSSKIIFLTYKICQVIPLVKCFEVLIRTLNNITSWFLSESLPTTCLYLNVYEISKTQKDTYCRWI